MIIDSLEWNPETDNNQLITNSGNQSIAEINSNNLQFAFIAANEWN